MRRARAAFPQALRAARLPAAWRTALEPAQRAGGEAPAAALGRRLRLHRHEMRWHAHGGLADREQVDLQLARQVAAVLEREHALLPAGRPAGGDEMSLGRGEHRLLRQLASRVVDGHRGVAALVRAGADHDHVPRLLRSPPNESAEAER